MYYNEPQPEKITAQLTSSAIAGNSSIRLEIIDGVTTELAVMALIDQLMDRTQRAFFPEAGMIALQLTAEERNRVILWAFDKYGPC